MSKDLTMFLDNMDATREARTMPRPEVWMMDGYRIEWYAYVDEWVDDNQDRG